MKAAYFPHDYNARTDPKLQQVMMTHGVAGLGVYWCLVEMMYEQGGKLPINSIQAIAYNLHTTHDIIKSIIEDFDLFAIKGDYFLSNAVQTRIVKKEEISEMKRRAAIARWGANAKQEQYTSNADAMQMHIDNNADAMQSKCRCNAIYKENKIKEKDNNIKQATSRFIAPKIEEIQAYITEKGYMMSAEEFYYFYDSKGWMVGSSKMKNWKSAVSRWAAEDARRSNNNNKPKQYAQPNNNTDKRRGFDVTDDAEYTTGLF